MLVPGEYSVRSELPALGTPTVGSGGSIPLELDPDSFRALTRQCTACVVLVVLSVWEYRAAWSWVGLPPIPPGCRRCTSSPHPSIGPALYYYKAAAFRFGGTACP